MSYTPYLIANFATGVQNRLQPWLIPDDAQQQLLDGFVYRGVMSKREGYNYFATGGQGGSTYRESRIVHASTAVAMVGAINGSNKIFTLAGTAQIARGSVTVTGSNPVQVLVDNGVGGFTGPGTGTINYTTGAISVTFTAAPIAASTVLVTYSSMPGLPVMMIAIYVAANNDKILLVADTTYINRFNNTLNILEDITVTPYTGTRFDFFTWVNYKSGTNVPRLLFSNNKDVIQQYDGTVVSAYAYTMTDQKTVPKPVTALTCSWMVEFKDRLILLRTTETTADGTQTYPQRLRVSGTGENSDNFTTDVTGAGIIDIPDGTWIMGATANRDDLIIFTQASTWRLSFTGNDTKPFVPNRIDESRGSDASFSAFTYLNRTSAASRRGLIISDGYRVERQDDAIPTFTFNEINQTNFALCFAGVVDADRDHFLIYPAPKQASSTRILTTNYDEDNYCIYRIPLSCMGQYKTNETITWNDLIIYKDWASLTAVYGNWNSFPLEPDVPVSLGGGHKGEIWALAVTEEEDNQVRIYNITVIDDVTVQVTTDWNNFSLNGHDPTLTADFIFLSGISGMEELNYHQFPIVTVIDNNNFTLNITELGILGSDLTAYTSGGYAERVIPLDITMKQFNPFIDQDKKVRCGWLYMYVDVAAPKLRRSVAIESITTSEAAIVTTDVEHGLSTGDQILIFGVGGMVEINGVQAYVTVIDKLTFSLAAIDSTLFTPYTSGGYVSIKENAKMIIEILTNDRKDQDITQLDNPAIYPYQGNMSNLTFEDGAKKWYKVFINQTGKFIQFKFRNNQAGAQINIQAFMPGFMPVGRLM